MPFKNLAQNYCSLRSSNLYFLQKIETKQMKYEALRTLCSVTKTLTLKQAADLELMKNRLYEKKRTVEVLQKEMVVIEQDISNLLAELKLDAIDYTFLDSTFRFRRQAINQKILVEKLQS